MFPEFRYKNLAANDQYNSLALTPRNPEISIIPKPRGKRTRRLRAALLQQKEMVMLVQLALVVVLFACAQCYVWTIGREAVARRRPQESAGPDVRHPF